MFRPHKIKWSDYRSKIVPDAKKQPIRHSQMERLGRRDQGRRAERWEQESGAPPLDVARMNISSAVGEDSNQESHLPLCSLSPSPCMLLGSKNGVFSTCKWTERKGHSLPAYRGLFLILGVFEVRGEGVKQSRGRTHETKRAWPPP